MKALLPFGLWVPGAARHPAGDDRRRDRGRRARQEPPHPGQLRQPRPLLRPADRRRLRPHARAPDRRLVGGARRRRPAVLGDDRRDGPDRRDRRRGRRAAARGDGVLHRRHRPLQRHRRPDGPDEHRRRRLQLLGRLVRRRHPGQAHGPGGADPRRQGQAVQLDPKRRRDPLQVRGAVVRDDPRGLPEPDGQRRHGQGVQRVLVPQGAQAPGRRAAEHHRVLPPARHRRRVEPGLRPERLPAVPVRRARSRRTRRSSGASR